MSDYRKRVSLAILGGPPACAACRFCFAEDWSDGDPKGDFCHHGGVIDYLTGDGRQVFDADREAAPEWCPEREQQEPA